MNATIVSVICAAVAAAVGVGGYFLGRDKHLAQDAFWRGEVNTQLDMILRMRRDVETLSKKVEAHSERIAKTEADIAEAHRRIDRMC